jgi:hypothetical protein
VAWMLKDSAKTYTMVMAAKTLQDKVGPRCPIKPGGSYSTDMLLANLLTKVGMVDKADATSMAKIVSTIENQLLAHGTDFNIVMKRKTQLKDLIDLLSKYA